MKNKLIFVLIEIFRPAVERLIQLQEEQKNMQIVELFHEYYHMCLIIIKQYVF